MSNVVPVGNGEVQFTPQQMKLITDTVARGASQDELQLFLYRCKSLGLDPLKPGQIHFVKYGNSPGTIVVGIDGFRAKAARTGKLTGIKRGNLRDEQGKAIGGWAEVYRTDWAHPARIEVSLSEYSTGNGPWKKMPETMIQKVAEAAALRMAFPDDLGGIYAQEEMDQASAPPVRPDQPGPNDGHTDDEALGYRIPFGKYAQRSLEEVGVERLRDYVRWMEDDAAKKGKKLVGNAAEFIERASQFIANFENGDVT